MLITGNWWSSWKNGGIGIGLGSICGAMAVHKLTWLRSHAALVLTGQELHIAECNLWGTREHLLARAEIAHVSVGEISFAVPYGLGMTPGSVLLIVMEDRRAIRLLGWRDRESLRRIARELHEGLFVEAGNQGVV